MDIVDESARIRVCVGISVWAYMQKDEGKGK
jgi:hypothetical protein